MNLDDIVELAAARTPTVMERARIRRTAKQIMRQSTEAQFDGLNLGDRFARDVDEALRVARSAQVHKLGTMIWRAGTRRVDWSDEMALLFGHAPGTVRLSRAFLLSTVHPDDRTMVEERIAGAWHDRAPVEFVVRIYRGDHTMRYLHCLVELLSGESTEEVSGIITTAQDVTEREIACQEDERRRRRRGIGRAELSERDPATGLLTPARFRDKVDTVAREGRGALFVVAVEPCTRSAPLTDAESDRLMSTVAGVLREIVDPGDVCGLAGPGEFGVLKDRVTAEDARASAAEVVHTLRAQLPLACRSGPGLRAWGGLVLFSDADRIGGTELLLDVRSAWRQSRLLDGDLTVLADPLSTAIRERVNRAEVRETINDDRLCLYSQPIFDLVLNQVTRHEILLRVLDLANRPQPPTAFLDMAERVDEVLAIDEWVIDRSMALIGAGPKPTTAGFQINLSGRSISHPGLLPMIEHALRRHQVEPDTITFEITESAVIQNMTAGVRFARGLESLGCRLALDDFGAGHASLRILKYLPIDLVKVDGDFVTGLPDSPFNQTVVRSIVEMCRNLGVRTVAEHVQDSKTVNLLREYGADFAQGYHFGRPTAVFPASSDEQPAVSTAVPALLHRATG